MKLLSSGFMAILSNFSVYLRTSSFSHGVEVGAMDGYELSISTGESRFKFHSLEWQSHQMADPTNSLTHQRLRGSIWASTCTCI